MPSPLTVTFIIPVRHQANSKDWPELCRRLAQTCRSIANQKNASWNAVVVANHGAELPALPSGFAVERVDFPPNEVHEQGNRSREEFLDAFRIDKGRRVLAGMLSVPRPLFFMIVDDDDFVSDAIAGFAAQNREASGWYIGTGYIWADGGDWLFRDEDFNAHCGTSLIVRSDLYDLPVTAEAADDHYIKRMLGSHVAIKGELQGRGTPLAPLPFTGAVYRVGHSGAHSKSQGLFSTHIWRLDNLTHPRRFLWRLRRIKRLNGKLRDGFGMSPKG